jgi:hypothetical protein
MRILLQKIESGLYFKDLDSWTHSSTEAMDFFTSTRAIEFCMAHGVTGVQLVLKFEEHQYDIVMPMQPAAESAPARPGRIAG